MNRPLLVTAVASAVGLWACSASLPPAEQVQPNIVFVLVDTLRADHLGCYGYDRPTSPNIDKIAQGGIRFESVFSVSDWTKPTIVSLFTGRYPQAVLPPAKHDRAVRLALPQELPTLAELLKEQGYSTAGLVDHPGISKQQGFARGFDDYTMLYLEGAGGEIWRTTDAGYVLQEFERTLDAMGEGPFYIYLHLIYPHHPYRAPEPYDEMFGNSHRKTNREQKRRIVNSYDGEIRFTDELIGDVFSALSSRQLLDSTYFILTSDHGEAFWEHGYRAHGRTFYSEVLRVPLVVYPPGGRGSEASVVTAPVSNIDLFPTLAAIGGAEMPAGIDGESLFRFLDGGDVPPSGPFFSESPHGYDIRGRAVIDGPLKYIHTPSQITKDKNRAYELYDWASDPGETENLAEARPETVERMHALMEEHRLDVMDRRSKIGETMKDVDPEMLERLRALGYTGD